MASPCRRCLLWWYTGDTRDVQAALLSRHQIAKYPSVILLSKYFRVCYKSQLTPSGVMYSPFTWIATTRPMTMSECPTRESPVTRRIEWTLHSNCTGDSATRGGLTTRLGALVTPAMGNSSSQDSSDDALTLSLVSYLKSKLLY